MANNKKIILITGGVGFIGSHLCDKYLKQGHKVICLDNLQTTHSTRNIDHLLPNRSFKFIKHDVINPIEFKEKIDWVINLACSGAPDIYQYDPIHTTRTNVEGVRNMLELARTHKARIMQASTSEVYGDPLESPQKETYTGNVNPLGPRACYDEGKRCAESLCMDYHREHGVDVKIIRIFNTYGPNMNLNDGRAMVDFITYALGKSIKAGGDKLIMYDPESKRSFQYIDDLVDGIDKMMRKDNFVGPVNLGNPGEITMLELAQAIIKKTNSKAEIIFDRPSTDDPKRRCPDISLAKKELGWEPKITLEVGIEKTINYFKGFDRPDRKVLIFATTYYPNLGPAEQALFELTGKMLETEFHIITSRFEKGNSLFEKKGNNHIYRVGFGNHFDKYLLPLLANFKAFKLAKDYDYNFVWSIMASYGSIPALILKFFKKNTNFLLLLDNKEFERKDSFKSKILTPFFHSRIFKKADLMFVPGFKDSQGNKIWADHHNVQTKEDLVDDFMSQVRLAYTNLLNRQEGRLSRRK